MKLSLRNKVTTNTLWNLVGAGSPMLLGIITIPYLLRQMGVEAFGILTLIWTLIGYFSLFDFGLGRALTQQVASNLAGGMADQIPNQVKSGILFTLGAGTIGGIILDVIAYPLGVKWLSVSVSLQQNTVYSLLIASLGIPLTTVTTGFRGVLEAYEDFSAANLLRILLGIANFGLPVLSIILFGASLPIIVASLVIARLFILAAHIILVNRKLARNWQTTKFNQKSVRSLLSFGAWITLSNIIGPLMVTSDRFIISSVLGASLVAYYTVPFDLLIRLLIVPGALASALFPRLAAILTVDHQAAKYLYKKSLKILAAIMFSISFIMSVGSFLILKIWLGEDFANNSWLIASVISVGLMFNGVAQLPFATIQAAGNARSTGMVNLVEFIFYLPLLFISLKYFGLLGAATLWSVRVLVDCIVLLNIANRSIITSWKK